MKVYQALANAFMREGTSTLFGLLGDGQLTWWDAMAKHPGWIELIGNKLDGVTPQKRMQFLEIAARSHVLARKRNAGHAAKTFAPEEILSPFRLADESPGATIRPAAATTRD